MTERQVLLAVPNISEGHREDLVASIAAHHTLLDVHSDPDHNRSVLTYGGEPNDVLSGCLQMSERAIRDLDLRHHAGVHPRYGVVDVLPFVTYLCDAPTAVATARRFAETASIPVHLYGAVDPRGRTLPELRRRLRSVEGHPSAGVICVGVRPPLVAFNVNLRGSIAPARQIVRALRSIKGVRALAFELPARRLVQVSTNLIDPIRVGPRLVFERTVALAPGHSLDVVDAEVVGLVPAPVLPDLDDLPLRTPVRSIERALGDRGSRG